MSERKHLFSALLILNLTAISWGNSIADRYATGTYISEENKLDVKDADWWKTAVFYQIYPRSFMDSDNNGVGDLVGIINRLDHLVDLGVTALWLSPIYKSPMKDFGYDISDFRDIDPTFGTMDDFNNLVTEAKNRNLRIIMDFVPNHSSEEHEWFIKAKANDTKYRDYYIWKPENEIDPEAPPNNWKSHFHGKAWTKVEKEWYLHQYASAQPDLNFRNEDVKNEMKEILKFWLDLGVDGFRVDTVPSLVEDEDFPDEEPNPSSDCPEEERCYWQEIHQTDQPETYDIVYEWRAFLDEYSKDKGDYARIMMTESYSPIDDMMKYYKDPDSNKLGAHFSFNFFFITQANKDSKVSDIVRIINNWNDKLPEGCISNWVLGNHDQHRLATRYGVDRSDVMIMLQMFLPGVAVTYNGEEIAMENGEVTYDQCQDPQGCNGSEEDFAKNSRDFERTPFQWSNETNAGFNAGTKPWLPVSDKYTTCNVNLQNINSPFTKSPLQLYKDLVKLRQSPVLLAGKLEITELSDNVLKVHRYNEDNHKFLILNIGSEIEEVTIGDNLPNLLLVEAASTKSSYDAGDTVFTGEKLKLKENEAIILSV